MRAGWAQSVGMLCPAGEGGQQCHSAGAVSTHSLERAELAAAGGSSTTESHLEE